MVEQNREQIEKLTEMAESGDKAGLMEELHCMDPAERAKVARQIDELNDENRKSNSGLPDIQLTVATDFMGTERLDDIVTKMPNDSKAWFKPWTWFAGSEITTDVYDPEHDRLGNGLLQKTAENISHHNRQVNEILEQMR